MIILKSDFVLIHDEPTSARITFGNKHAELKNLGGGLYKVTGIDQEWILNRRINGEIRPFSIVVSKGNDSKEVLKIDDHIFLHNGSFYIIGGIPEGGIPRHHLVGSKFICRLTNFPFSHPDQVDAETKNRLKRHRGVPVGEFFGLGSNGFHIKLESELDGIGLPLAASTYLIYSSI